MNQFRLGDLGRDYSLRFTKETVTAKVHPGMSINILSRKIISSAHKTFTSKILRIIPLWEEIEDKKKSFIDSPHSWGRRWSLWSINFGIIESFFTFLPLPPSFTCPPHVKFDPLAQTQPAGGCTRNSSIFSICKNQHHKHPISRNCYKFQLLHLCQFCRRYPTGKRELKKPEKKLPTPCKWAEKTVYLKGRIIMQRSDL